MKNHLNAPIIPTSRQPGICAIPRRSRDIGLSCDLARGATTPKQPLQKLPHHQPTPLLLSLVITPAGPTQPAQVILNTN